MITFTLQQAQVLDIPYNSPYNSNETIAKEIRYRMIEELKRKIDEINPEDLMTTQTDGMVAIYRIECCFKNGK